MPKTTIVRDIEDFKVARITTDQTASYITEVPIDLPGVSTLSTALEFDTDELRGDGVIKDVYSKIDKVTGSFSGCIDLDVMEALLGGYVATPTGSNLYRMTPEAAKYFYFEGKVDAHGGNEDLHIRCWKARVTNVTMELGQQTYMTFSADFEAIPANYVEDDTVDGGGTGKLFWDVEIFDASTAITTTAVTLS